MQADNSPLASAQDILIRPIQAADNPEVAQLIRTVMTEYTCVGEGYSINDPEVDHMSEAYAGPKASFFVIVDAEGIAGCGGIAPLKNGSADVCELQKMYFYQRLRGKGLGRQLLHLCLDQARQFGYRRCYLETVARMKKANALYQKAGFQLLKEQIGQTGHGACDLYYVLDL
ncbi:MAG: GNAT family N-acetyltransferase [Bacteroidota bacterium]